ncbi:MULTISPECIES: siderophore-interacting protein [unclassified Frankia]
MSTFGPDSSVPSTPHPTGLPDGRDGRPSASAENRPAPRHARPAPRRLRVVRVTPLTGDMVTVTLGGPALAGFSLPRAAQHVKIFLPADGQTEPTVPGWGPDGRPVFPAGAPRPIVRTYTPRRFDAEALELEIEMLLHGEGPAGRWAGTARPGDHLAIAGPGGGYEVRTSAAHHLLAADETGLPALATVLERLPTRVPVTVVAEVRDAGRQRALPVTPATTVTWLHRNGGVPGALLAEAVEAIPLPAGTAAWVACEATAVRRIRRHLLASGLDRADLSTRGYWRLSAADHPDHDYGEGEAADVTRGGEGRIDRLRRTLGPLKQRAETTARGLGATVKARAAERRR